MVGSSFFWGGGYKTWLGVIVVLFLLEVDLAYNGVTWSDSQATRAMCWETPEELLACDVVECSRSDRWFTRFYCGSCDPEWLACGFHKRRIPALMLWPRVCDHCLGHMTNSVSVVFSIQIQSYQLKQDAFCPWGFVIINSIKQPLAQSQRHRSSCEMLLCTVWVHLLFSIDLVRILFLTFRVILEFQKLNFIGCGARALFLCHLSMVLSLFYVLHRQLLFALWRTCS